LPVLTLMRGQQYRVRGDVQARLFRGRAAPVISRPGTRHPPPSPNLAELDAIFINTGCREAALTTVPEARTGPAAAARRPASPAVVGPRVHAHMQPRQLNP